MGQIGARPLEALVGREGRPGGGGTYGASGWDNFCGRLSPILSCLRILVFGHRSSCLCLPRLWWAFCAPGTVGTGLCLRESERSGHRPHSARGKPLAHMSEPVWPVVPSEGRCPFWGPPWVDLGICIDLSVTLALALTFLASEMAQDRAGLQTPVLKATSTAFSMAPRLGFAVCAVWVEKSRAEGGESRWKVRLAPSEVGCQQGLSGWWASLCLPWPHSRTPSLVPLLWLLTSAALS